MSAPKILDILLSLRTIEDLLLTELESRSDQTEYNHTRDVLEHHELPAKHTTENIIEDVFSQLTYVEDAVHILVKNQGLKAIETISQYKQHFNKP